MAPPSWRAARKVAPCSTMALVTTKLPLPSSPKTCSAPSPTSARPTASATFTVRAPLYQRQHASRAAGPADDRERRGDQHGAGRGQPGDVRKLGQAVLAGPEQE